MSGRSPRERGFPDAQAPPPRCVAVAALPEHPLAPCDIHHQPIRRIRRHQGREPVRPHRKTHHRVMVRNPIVRLNMRLGPLHQRPRMRQRHARRHAGTRRRFRARHHDAPLRHRAHQQDRTLTPRAVPALPIQPPPHKVRAPRREMQRERTRHGPTPHIEMSPACPPSCSRRTAPCCAPARPANTHARHRPAHQPVHRSSAAPDARSSASPPPRASVAPTAVLPAAPQIRRLRAQLKTPR
jgi:hypothetical protein